MFSPCLFKKQTATQLFALGSTGSSNRALEYDVLLHDESNLLELSAFDFRSLGVIGFLESKDTKAIIPK